MRSNSGTDTSRTVVQVYVPAYQRDEWDLHADELDMSRSEFVKTMVQAGRSGFGASPTGVTESSESTTDGTDGTNGTDTLSQQILETLEDSGCLSWDELLAAVTGDIETRLEKSLQELQNNGEVRHSGRKGGYILDDE